MTTLVASAARTADGNSGALTPLPHPELVRSARFVLDVTAAATEAGDTLDVYVQHTYDGTNYTDLAHFTQILGNGGAKTFMAEWFRDTSPETEHRPPQDAALAASAVLQGGQIGTSMRVKWVVVDVATTLNQSFTFSVTADFQLARRRM